MEGGEGRKVRFLSRHTRFLDEARDDLNTIAWYIATQSGSAEVAEAFVESLRARCESFARLPGTLGTARPELGEGIRSPPHRGYLVFFRYAADAVEIVNVLHGSRDVVRWFGGGSGDPYE